jgi:putative transposase
VGIQTGIGRFKSFPVQTDEHLLTVCRYLGRNALTARIVSRAEAWRWGSLWVRSAGSPELRALPSDGPVARPRNWIELVNAPLAANEVERVRLCMARNRPLGDEAWPARPATRLGLQHTLRPEGRPRKKAAARPRDN